MYPSRLVIFLLLVLSVIGLIQNIAYWFHLPEQVATHFNSRGNPNDWMSRNAAVVLMTLLQIILPIGTTAIGSISMLLPPSLINVPHRDFWLHPDRIDHTRAYTVNALGWISIATSLLLMSINHLSFVANTSSQPLNTSLSFIALVAYLTVVFSIVIGLWVHFGFRRE